MDTLSSIHMTKDRRPLSWLSLRPGDKVLFRNGGSAIVYDLEGTYIEFELYGGHHFNLNGECGKSRMLDIIGVQK